MHGSPRDEEDDEGAVAALHHTAHKGFLTEVQVQLAWSVELRILETPAVIHILQKETKKKSEFEFLSYFRLVTNFASLPGQRGSCRGREELCKPDCTR